MLARCIETQPTLPQAVRLGKFFRAGEQEFPVEVGKTYAVYGLRLWGAGAWVDIESDMGYLVTVPLCLFEVVDGRVPHVWVARVDPDGDLALLPESFHEAYFLDDLIEGKPEARRLFSEVKAQMLPRKSEES